MILHQNLHKSELRQLLKNKSIVLGGNRQLKIYGSLRCKSGKRMNKNNRVFFSSEQEAIDAGYRPCGHCMRAQYKIWKTTDGSFQQ